MALPCRVSLISFRDSRRGLSLLLHLTPSPFGHESHCPGEVHQGQSDPKVTQLTAGTGAEDRPRFAIPVEARPVFSSEEASATPGVGQVASNRNSRCGLLPGQPAQYDQKHIFFPPKKAERCVFFGGGYMVFHSF